MAKRLTRLGLLAVLMVMLLLAVACGDDATTETTAGGTETTAGGTETTAGGTETTAGGTETTTAGPATGEPLKIGLIASLSGTAAAPMASMQAALDLEVETINAAGGVNGRPIEIISVDDKSDPTTAVAVATKLITQDEVIAILGPLSTPPCLAVAPLCEKYEVPMLRWDTPTIEYPNAMGKWDFICSVGPDDVADALMTQIKAEGWKNILAAADILPPNYQSLELLKDMVAEAGATITVLPDTWPLDATDLTPFINKIWAAYQDVKPDVVFAMSSIVQAPQIVKGLKDMGVTVPIQSGPVSAHPAILSMGPEIMEDFLFIGAGITNPSQLPDDYPNKALMLDLATRYTAKYDEVPTLFAGAAYDSFHILLEGLKVGGDDKAKVRDAIEAITNFPVSQGVVNYSATDHRLHGGYNEWTVKSGVFTFVRILN
jgi:branched-chain amino acid transport system substrate-binding protein